VSATASPQTGPAGAAHGASLSVLRMSPVSRGRKIKKTKTASVCGVLHTVEPTGYRQVNGARRLRR
jgi:hypothetical protein